jgi:hypothetical protein
LETFEAWLDALRARRESWVVASRVNDFDRGIWNATVEKYADPSHFVFELLQNAEDAGASWGRFELTPSSILFEHNGRPFDRGDVEGITGIGNTTKFEEANKIGCFGIGFKSVYAICERPEVHGVIEGRPVGFAIRDLVVPELIETTHTGATTRFVLHLAIGTVEATINRVRNTLAEAGARSLLYLEELKRLDWTDGADIVRCTIEEGAGGVRTLRCAVGGQPDRIERFLVLSRPVRRDDAASDLAVKIALRLDGGGEIVAETAPTRLAVFFETEEPTGLHFHVHGPFQLTDNRANIKRDNLWNRRLAAELAILLAESLPGLRDQGFVKRGLLDMLPNTGDELPDPWDQLRDAAVTAFRDGELVPAQFGGYVRASEALSGPADIRDLLRDEGLVAFAGKTGRRWAAGVLRNSRADGFLSGLQIPEWGPSELLSAFQRAFGPTYYVSDAEAARTARAWFDALGDDAVQRLYLLVAAARSQKRVSLANAEFVRLEDGSRARPGNALLPPAGTPLDEEAAAHGLVLVRTALRSGRRGSDVERFLRDVGVNYIGERDYLTAIIRANYAGGAPSPAADRHMQHMRRFLAWHASHGDARIFDNATFLRAEGSEGYYAAENLYLDRPYVISGLSLIYDGTVSGRNRRPLWGGYSRLNREQLLALLKAIGVESALSIYRTNIPYGHPHWSDLRYGFGSVRVTGTGENIDYTIPQLPGLLARSNPDISKQIWRAVAACGSHIMRASYAPNQSHEPHRAPSTLALCLRDAEWIPANDGSLRRPSAMTGAELATGYTTKGNEEWLQAIGFGAEHRRRSDDHQARRRAAATIGLPEELADQLATLSPEALKAFGTEMLRKVESGTYAASEFPEREAPNPERRAQRLAERVRTAPQRSYEIRERSVRTSDQDTRQMARPYLLACYMNTDDELICQACHQPMPFRLPAGSPYFEAVDLLAISVEIQENHLALCPTCCAKWHHARTTSDAEVLDAISAAKASEITVTLAAEDVRVRFV